jgi:addiction module HigA family antidote
MRRSPTHPGEIFGKDFRQPLGLSQSEVARRLGITPRQVNEIEHGKRAVTPRTALLFAALTGSSAEFWMNLQARYDLWHELQKNGPAVVHAPTK